MLGNDLLIFLCVTIGIVPLFKALNASPVIGFLAAGLLMGPAGMGLFSDLSDMESLLRMLEFYFCYLSKDWS